MARVSPNSMKWTLLPRCLCCEYHMRWYFNIAILEHIHSYSTCWLSKTYEKAIQTLSYWNKSMDGSHKRVLHLDIESTYAIAQTWAEINFGVISKIYICWGVDAIQTSSAIQSLSGVHMSRKLVGQALHASLLPHATTFFIFFCGRSLHRVRFWNFIWDQKGKVTTTRDAVDST